ncbi:hypothetical protein [Actinophytocola sp.]|uniref:hypothetical protein n=1 Tax=Actinophytocola sp. TaxID=1872138 RepID=UPI0025C12E5C|nr:hypothetical protein [Actinophytocola sp.]
MSDIDTTNAGGLEVTDGPSGPREGVEDAKLTVEGADGGEMDRIATNAIADLYEYWEKQLPDVFDEKFEELTRLVSYDSDGAGVTICGASTAGLVNAFYCGGGGEDAIAWDRGVLLPMLSERFGSMSVVGVLAHEMGHAVQFRLGEKSNMSESTPTILREQQADCYMGNFFRHVAEGDSKHFQINTGKGLNDILATLFYIRDPAGFDHMTEGAHGLAFDRVYAFQEGFANDPQRCADMDPEEIDGRIAEKERTEAEVSQSDEATSTRPRTRTCRPCRRAWTTRSRRTAPTSRRSPTTARPARAATRPSRSPTARTTTSSASTPTRSRSSPPSPTRRHRPASRAPAVWATSPRSPRSRPGTRCPSRSRWASRSTTTRQGCGPRASPARGRASPTRTPRTAGCASRSATWTRRWPSCCRRRA